VHEQSPTLLGPAPRIQFDKASVVDTIVITMIRRSPKADPKQRSLEESGTANPHAQNVRNPAFIDSDFFDPRDLIQVKYEMLRRVRTEGQSVAKASATFGVSRPTFYKARSDFDRGGLVGLLPSKRGPRGPHKISPEVTRFIEETVVRGEELTPQDAVFRGQIFVPRQQLLIHRPGHVGKDARPVHNGPLP
jgi:hypothetical protein